MIKKCFAVLRSHKNRDFSRKGRDCQRICLNRLTEELLYYEEFDVPSATGYNKKVKGKECYYVVRDENKLMLPMLDYIYKNEIFAVVKKEINNRFNENSISDLNDTLLIREYVIELE